MRDINSVRGRISLTVLIAGMALSVLSLPASAAVPRSEGCELWNSLGSAPEVAFGVSCRALSN